MSSRDTAYLWDKNIPATLKSWGVRNTVKCGLGKKGIQPSDVVLLSESRGTRVTNGSDLSGGLSETLASGNREYVQKIFHSKQC